MNRREFVGSAAYGAAAVALIGETGCAVTTSDVLSVVLASAVAAIQIAEGLGLPAGLATTVGNVLSAVESAVNTWASGEPVLTKLQSILSAIQGVESSLPGGIITDGIIAALQLIVKTVQALMGQSAPSVVGMGTYASGLKPDTRITGGILREIAAARSKL